MSTITIKNIGPIREVKRLEIKRINLFMGPQASGKSTIAKIISQALWAEKNYLTMGEEYDFYKGLIAFHNMDKTYFSAPDAEISYESPWCTIHMLYVSGKRCPQTTYVKKVVKELYHNAKIEYIPAERNFVASIANIRKYTENYNSTIGFLGDWYAAKAKYQRSNYFSVDLPDLAFSYRYKESEERDILRIENRVEVELKSSSSGQQSLLPLLLVANEVMIGTYESQKIFSPAEIAHIRKASKDMASVVDLLATVSKKARTKELEKQLDALWGKIGYKGDYGNTHLVIEEPEQNLYPSTQRGLLKYLVSLLTRDERHKHTLTLTTHSPYILYALNNCMLASKVASQKGKEYLLKKKTTGIAPDEVGLWLMREGRAISLQDDKHHLLKTDLFNAELQANHNEMFDLLKLADLSNEEKFEKTAD